MRVFSYLYCLSSFILSVFALPMVTSFKTYKIDLCNKPLETFMKFLKFYDNEIDKTI